MVTNRAHLTTAVLVQNVQGLCLTTQIFVRNVGTLLATIYRKTVSSVLSPPMGAKPPTPAPAKRQPLFRYFVVDEHNVGRGLKDLNHTFRLFAQS